MTFRTRAATAVLVSALLCGCGADPEEPEPSDAAPRPSATEPSASPTAQTLPPSYVPLPFTVVESAFTTSDDTAGGAYVHWVAVINNPNTTHLGEFPTMTITARDAAGAVLGTDQQVLGELPPGARIGWAGQLSSSALPAVVEVTYADVQWTEVAAVAADFPPILAEGVSLTGRAPFQDVVGELVNPYAGDIGSVAVTALFRDGEGRLVGGHTGFVNGLPASGRLPFSISAATGGSPPPASSVEISAIPWFGDLSWIELSQVPVTPSPGEV